MNKQSVFGESLAYYPPVATHLLEAPGIEQPYRIHVMLPLMKPADRVRFPVVYMPDANAYFDACKAIAYSMQLSSAVTPRFILVGIGYPGDSPCAGIILRARDLTFPGYPEFDLTPPPMQGVLTSAQGQNNYLGGEVFLDFIEQQLMPFIDARYPTLPSDRTYFGHSAGGGLGLFALAQRTDLFNGYIISSPGVTFHGQSSAGITYEHHDVLLQRLEALISSGRSLEGKRVYVSAGAEEEFETEIQQWRLTSSLYRLTGVLRKARALGLELTSEILEHECHATAWPLAFIHGLRAVMRCSLR